MNQDLISTALLEQDPEQRWELVSQIHKSADRADFERAVELARGSSSSEIELGVDILAQLGCLDERPFQQETIAVLLKICARETRPEILRSLGYACGHVANTENHVFVDFLVSISMHSSPTVRHAAIFGLSGHEDERAISSMVRLCDDEDQDNRNWATFGIGSQIEADSETIRDALIKNLDDEDDEVRGEALLGLAQRRDTRVVGPLLNELKMENVGTLVVEAASVLGNSQLYDALCKLQTWWDIDENLLNTAITNCSENYA